MAPVREVRNRRRSYFAQRESITAEWANRMLTAATNGRPLVNIRIVDGKGGDVRKTGGAWYEPGKWDAVKKKRGPATIMIGLEFLDSKYRQKGTAGGTNRTSEKDMPMTAWFH